MDTLPLHICFWCEKHFKHKHQLTKDHLITKPMRELYKLDNSDIVKACKRCNTRRALITCALCRVIEICVYERGVSPRAMRRFRELQDRLVTELEFFETQIRRKLTGEIQRLCLAEIHYVRDNQSPIKGVVA